MKTLLIGDVHGDFEKLRRYLNFAKKTFKITKAIQLGDFGFYGDIPEKMPVPVYTISGNHEDHSLFTKENIESWKEKNIFYVKDGTVEDGMGFCGKALNVDRPNSDNFYKDVSFCKFDGLDFVFTHSCPHSIGVGMVGDWRYVRHIHEYITVPHGLSTGPFRDCGEPCFTDLWHSLKVKPKYWIFAHFHCYHDKKVGETRFVCLDRIDGKSEVIPFILENGELKSFPYKRFK